MQRGDRIGNLDVGPDAVGRDGGEVEARRPDCHWRGNDENSPVEWRLRAQFGHCERNVEQTQSAQYLIATMEGFCTSDSKHAIAVSWPVRRYGIVP